MMTDEATTDTTADDAWTDVPIAARFARVLARVDRIHRDQVAKVKTKTGPEYSYNYTDINSILAMLKPILADHHLALSQPIVPYGDNGNMEITTKLICPTTGDELVLGGLVMIPKGDPQALGKTITYYRRYAIVSVFALEADDDDGAAGNRAATRPQHRTEAEGEVRKIVKALSREHRDQFTSQFKDTFGMTLTNLPESAHGDALTWAKQWEFVTETDAEDAAWVAAASDHDDGTGY